MQEGTLDYFFAQNPQMIFLQCTQKESLNHAHAIKYYTIYIKDFGTV